MTDFEQKVLNRIAELYASNKLSNDFLVKNIELSGNFLNLVTKSAYSRQFGISYQGVKSTKTRQIKDLFGVKFVVDND